MIANVGRKPDANQSIRSLFIIGVVGLILAASGVTWLLGGYAQEQILLAQKQAQEQALLPLRATMYKGTWVEKENPLFVITTIKINNNGVNMTIQVSGNCRELTYLPCDMGTYTQKFTGEPFTILLVFTDSNGTRNSWPLVMNLSNTDGTKLQVLVNNTYSGFFDKT